MKQIPREERKRHWIALRDRSARGCWAATFFERQRGGAILALLSFGLLLFGGGIFPPVIGIIGGVRGIRINMPLKMRPGPTWSILGKMWPWTIVAFFVGQFGKFVIGQFFNEFLMQSELLIPVLIAGLMVVSILTGYGHNVQKNELAEA